MCLRVKQALNYEDLAWNKRMQNTLLIVFILLTSWSDILELLGQTNYTIKINMFLFLCNVATRKFIMPCALHWHFYWKVLVGVLVHQTLKDTSRRALGSQEALTQTVTAPGSRDQGVTRRKSNKASLHVVSNLKWQVLCLSLGSRCWWGGLARGQRSPRKQVDQILEPTLAPNTRLPLPGCSLSRQSSTLLWNWRPWLSSWSVKGRGQGEVGLGALPSERGRKGGTMRLGLAQKGRWAQGL